MVEILIILAFAGAVFFIPWLFWKIFAFIRNGLSCKKYVAALKMQIRELKKKLASAEGQLKEKERVIRKKESSSAHIRKDTEERIASLSRCLDEEKKKSELLALYLFVLDEDGSLADRSPELRGVLKDMKGYLEMYDPSVTDRLKSELRQNGKMTFPGVATVLADFRETYDSMRIDTLSGRAYKAKELAALLRDEKKLLQTRCTEAEALIAVYEELFPWLEEFRDVCLGDAVEYARGTLSDGGYDKSVTELTGEGTAPLPSEERAKGEFDRYAGGDKDLWEAGLEYERYITSIYKNDGYATDHVGACNELTYMGRYIMASKGTATLVIRCIYSRNGDPIHEKHVLHLFNTVFVMTIRDPDRAYRPVLYTTAPLSVLASVCAMQLGMTVYSEFSALCAG